jgi:hypothetical protein
MANPHLYHPDAEQADVSAANGFEGREGNYGKTLYQTAKVPNRSPQVAGECTSPTNHCHCQSH